MHGLSCILSALLPSLAACLSAAHADSIPGLSFIHIPKNAGSSVELTSTTRGLHWGRHDKYGRCPNFHCPPWHVPPSWMKGVCGRTYKYRDTFCVTRDPFTRMLSEYRYLNFIPNKNPCRSIVRSHGCTPAGLNACLTKLLKRVISGDVRVRACHMLPQSRYVWDFTNRAGADGERDRSCNHILRIEDLPQAFNDLMTEKHIPVRLTSKRANTGPCRNLNAADLSPQVIKLAHEVYRDDFRRLNYSTEAMTAKSQREQDWQEFFLIEDSPDEPGKKKEFEAPF